MGDCNLNVIGCSSSGNGYVLECCGNRLILECGVKLNDILPVCDWNTASVSGVLVTHRHGDHAKYIKDFARFFDVYAHPDVAGMAGVRGLEDKKRYKVGDFTVMPLSVPHSVPNYAYIIEHEMLGRMLFCTDAISFPYRIMGIHTVVMECNYVDDVIVDNMDSGLGVSSDYKSHMSLDSSVSSVRRVFSPVLGNVILTHLSKANSDHVVIRERFSRELGIPVEIAVPGSVFDVGRYDF